MYKTGLIIGRFQPFHKGHEYVFRAALEQGEKLIVGIGSTNTQDKQKNPYLVQQVQQMIRSLAVQKGWKKRIIQTLTIPDFPNDDVWLQYILDHALHFDVVISNNDWVTNIFRTAGHEVIEFPFYKRNLYEGVKIRKLMRQKKNWHDRVPEAVLDSIIHA